MKTEIDIPKFGETYNFFDDGSLMKTLTSRKDCICTSPCFRYKEGHCGGTGYEYYYHCEQLDQEGVDQRQKFIIELLDRNND